jgi:hypothetical protein
MNALLTPSAPPPPPPQRSRPSLPLSARDALGAPPAPFLWPGGSLDRAGARGAGADANWGVEWLDGREA